VGDHIVGFVAGQGDEAGVWERRLWRFVSQATENQLDGDALQRVYLKVIGEPLTTQSHDLEERAREHYRHWHSDAMRRTGV